jgi:hypothetical protein
MKEFLDELLVQIELLAGKMEGKSFRVTGFEVSFKPLVITINITEDRFLT